MDRMIESFELVDHGIQHEQYFQGCGVSCTEYTDIATGMGDNPREAIDDALEQLACNGWDVDAMEERIIEQELPGKRVIPCKPAVGNREDCHYYLSIRVK